MVLSHLDQQELRSLTGRRPAWDVNPACISCSLFLLHSLGNAVNSSVERVGHQACLRKLTPMTHAKHAVTSGTQSTLRIGLFHFCFPGHRSTRSSGAHTWLIPLFLPRLQLGACHCHFLMATLVSTSPQQENRLEIYFAIPPYLDFLHLKL